MKECPEKRKVPGNKEQKVTGCFRCRSVKHSVRNISQSAAAEKLGFWVEGADRERRVGARTSPWKHSKSGLQKTPVLS